MSAKNGLERSGTVTRSLPDRSVLKFFAVALGTYPSNSTAFITRRRVLSETIFGRLRTRDTVAVETRARLATSKMFGVEGSAIRPHNNTASALSRGTSCGRNGRNGLPSGHSQVLRCGPHSQGGNR